MTVTSTSVRMAPPASTESTSTHVSVRQHSPGPTATSTLTNVLFGRLSAKMEQPVQTQLAATTAFVLMDGQGTTARRTLTTALGQLVLTEQLVMIVLAPSIVSVHQEKLAFFVI